LDGGLRGRRLFVALLCSRGMYFGWRRFINTL